MAKTIKYLFILILLLIGLSYAGYYLYMFDKKNVREIDPALSQNIALPVEPSSDTPASSPALTEVKGVKEVAPPTSPAVKEVVPASTQKPEPKAIPEYLTTEFHNKVTPEQLKEQLKSIANINSARSDTSETMLVMAVRDGQYPEIIDILMQAGADPTLKTGRGSESKATILHWAIIRTDKAYEFVQTVLKYIQNIDEPDSTFSASALHWALYNRRDVKIIKLLLTKGADIEFKSKSQSNPIFSATVPNEFTGVKFIDPVVIQLLLDHGASVMVKNNEGGTAYDYMKNNKEFSKTNLFKTISKSINLKSSPSANPPANPPMAPTAPDRP